MNHLKAKDLEKPTNLSVGTVVKLQKKHLPKGASRYAVVKKAQELEDPYEPCTMCSLFHTKDCRDVFNCYELTADVDKSLILQPCTESGDPL